MEDVDRGVEYLAAARIDPRGTHGVGDGYRCVAQAGVFDVVGIELRVVFGVGQRLHGVLEPDFGEKLVPLHDALIDCGLPLFGEIRVDVEDDRPDGFDLLAALPGLRVRRLQPPAVGQVEGLHALLLVTVEVFPGGEYRHAAVGDAGAVGLLVEQHQRAGHDGGQGLVVHDFLLRHGVRHRVGVAQRALHREVVGERLDAAQRRELLLERLAEARRPRTAVSPEVRERRQLLDVAHEEVRDVDDHGRRVGVVGVDFEIAEDGRDVVPVERTEDVPGHAQRVVVGVDLPDLHAFARLGEGDVERRVGFRAGDSREVVRGLRNHRPQQHFASEERLRKFEIEFVVDLVQLDHAIGDLVFLLEEFVVCALLGFGRCGFCFGLFPAVFPAFGLEGRGGYQGAERKRKNLFEHKSY